MLDTMVILVISMIVTLIETSMYISILFRCLVFGLKNLIIRFESRLQFLWVVGCRVLAFTI